MGIINLVGGDDAAVGDPVRLPLPEDVQRPPAVHRVLRSRLLGSCQSGEMDWAI